MMYVSQMLNGEWGWPIYLHLLGSCVGKCRLSIYDTWIIFQLYIYIYIYLCDLKKTYIYIYVCVIKIYIKQIHMCDKYIYIYISI